MLEYALVSVLAFFAGGWVIPIGVVLGLEPFRLWAAAALGSCAGVATMVYIGGRGRDAVTGRLGSNVDGRVGDRARVIVDKWGVTGLAVVGTVVFGPTLSTLAAIALDLDRRRFTVWAIVTTLGIATVLTVAWTAVVNL